ncbi:hypothetical protein [Bernardetia sp.]|uniref:hypothetical protein n=1 Tax=Bernardetia sp. TaxID=1937974 RepID=UPI0025BAFBE9|nr:hypothetical protein [Bernardetia sp.]
MKKEKLTKEDKAILKKGRKLFSLPLLSIILIILMLCGSYIYYFRENYFDHYHRWYWLDLGMLVLVGVVLIIIFIIIKVEILIGYKWVIIGYIDHKEVVYNEGATYYLFIRETRITVLEKDYNTFEQGQKIRVDRTAILKQTIRVLPL